MNEPMIDNQAKPLLEEVSEEDSENTMERPSLMIDTPWPTHATLRDTQSTTHIHNPQSNQQSRIHHCPHSEPQVISVGFVVNFDSMIMNTFMRVVEITNQSTETKVVLHVCV